MLKLVAAICAIIAAGAGGFVAGMTFTTMPGGTKPHEAPPKPGVGQKLIDAEDEAQMERGAMVKGFQTIGLINECTRRKEDLNMAVGPQFKALDQKSKAILCETVYCNLLQSPKEYKLNEYNEVLKIHDENGGSLGTFSGKAGLRLKEEKPASK